MNPVPPHPLPHLPPEDHTRLLRYLSLNEDLAKLAADPGQPDLLSLLHWLSRPEIAAYIAAYHAHQNHLHRQAVIASLRSVLSTSTDQVELRRAATTLLRALSQGGTPLRGVRWPSSPTMGGGGGVRRQADGGGSVPTSSTHPPHTRSARSHHAPSNRASPSPLTHSPLHPSTPSSPPPNASTPSSPPLPAPTLSPLAEALAALGLPTDLDELDRLDDEADDAQDDVECDADLDAYCDDEDPPFPTNTS